MEHKAEKCAHLICHCDAQPDSKYCSAYCEGEGEAPDLVCNCGHAGCDHEMPAE